MHPIYYQKPVIDLIDKKCYLQLLLTTIEPDLKEKLSEKYHRDQHLLNFILCIRYLRFLQATVDGPLDAPNMCSHMSHTNMNLGGEPRPMTFIY